MFSQQVALLYTSASSFKSSTKAFSLPAPSDTLMLLSCPCRYFWFCVPCLFLAFPVTQYFMMFPPLGQPKSCWKAYIKDHGILALWGFLSGVTVSAANILQFLGGQAAGYAASDLVQANPIVATIWGIAFFREYRKSSRGAYICLALMYLMYISAVVLLAVSAETRAITS